MAAIAQELRLLGATSGSYAGILSRSSADGSRMNPTDGAARGRTPRARSYLMCPPEHFTVQYAINPWMDPARPVDVARAMTQWENLRETYTRLCDLPTEAGVLSPAIHVCGYRSPRPQS